MSEQQSDLVVSPDSLKFKFIPNQPLHAKISLHNPSKDCIEFSIKPNQPTRYFIKTQTGYVDPGKIFEIDIHMHASSEAPIDVVKDKFMIEFVLVGKDLKKVEVSVVLIHLEQDEIKVEQSSSSCLELLKAYPRSTPQQEVRTFSIKNLKDNENAGENPTNLEELKATQIQLQNKKTDIEMANLDLQDDFEFRGENSMILKVNENYQNNDTKEPVAISIQQDDMQFQGDNSMTLTVNENDQNDNTEEHVVNTLQQDYFQLRGDNQMNLTVNKNDQNNQENVVQNGNRRIDIQGTIRESIRSYSEFFSDVLQKDLTSGRVFLTFPLDLLFTSAIRAYSAQVCQILLGMIIFIAAMIYFWWLFAQFNTCQIQVIETTDFPENSNWCIPRLDYNTEVKALNLKGIWEGDQNYNARNAGPWQFKFVAYQADEQMFLSNINNLVKTSQNFTRSQQNKTFIKTLGATLFFSVIENGTNGAVKIAANIDLEMVFDNYKYTKFSLINLQQELLESVGQNLSARIGNEQQLPVQNCRGELIHASNKKYYCQKLIYEGTHQITSEMGALTYTAPPVTYFNVFKDKFFPNVTKYSRQANIIRCAPSLSSTSVSDILLAYPEEPFISQFSIQEAFVYNYCNNEGKEYCLNATRRVLEEDQDDFFYTWIPGFLGELGSNIDELSQVGQRYGVVKYEIYINSLDMFGIYIGKKQVLPEHGGPNTIYGFVMVPQLVQFDLQDEEMVCRSCFESAPYDNTTDCQKNIHVILHLYAFPMSQYQKDFSQQNLTAQETIEQFYVTSFIHGLERWHRSNRNALRFNGNASEPEASHFQDYSFFYNQKFGSVNDLHCNGTQQWAFKESLNISVPFLLETGIKSCEVKNCPGWLKSLGDAWANLELAYLIIILFLSIVILLVLYIMYKSQQDRQQGAMGLREALAAFIDQIRNG